jgi:ribosomal protein L21E
MQFLEGLQEEGHGELSDYAPQTELIRTSFQIALSTYLRQYKVGDIVDVVANGTGIL